jgi:glucosyl-dolichyl phosphate glucuronosyltransferase
VPAASVTVAICTWNRDHLLRQTLEEMTRLAVPAGLVWELLVVNNNCTDDTDGVIAAFAKRLPIRRLFESQPGLSHARNRAIAEAAGDYVVWTDDDVLVSPEWLAAYARAFARRPDAAVFGGPVAPWFPTTPPPRAGWSARGRGWRTRTRRSTTATRSCRSRSTACRSARTW